MNRKAVAVFTALAVAAMAAGCAASESDKKAESGAASAASAETADSENEVKEENAETPKNEEKAGDQAMPETNPNRVVTVSASGSVSVTPDMAKITMGVFTEADTAAEAQSKNAETINAVTEKLKELGVEEKSIQTANYYMSQRYDYEKNQPNGYRVDVSLTVADQKIGDVGKIIAACTESGANQFQGIYMTSSEYDAAYEQALASAVAEARQKAEVLAEAAGSQLGAVLSVTEGYQDTSARYRSANYYVESPMEESAKASADMAVMPGEMAIQAPVTVTYILK